MTPVRKSSRGGANSAADTSSAAVLKRFEEFLTSQKLRKTPERRAVLEQALSFTQPFSVQQVERKLEEENYYVSQATLYNTMRLLTDCGIFRKVIIRGNITHYDRMHSDAVIHLVCTDCGKVKEVKDTHFAAYMNARKFTAFTTTYYDLTVHGVCTTCLRKQKKNSKKKTK